MWNLHKIHKSNEEREEQEGEGEQEGTKKNIVNKINNFI